jgi:hypothetical protein
MKKEMMLIEIIMKNVEKLKDLMRNIPYNNDDDDD